VVGRDEFELIARYFAPLAQGVPGAFDLLDDAALISPAAGCELVAKTDAIVAGVHFLPDDPPDLVARKALRVNLSDLAAKGAEPRAYLLDLMLPESVGEDWLAELARGLAADQEEYAIRLIGGDTNATPGPATIAVVAFGEVPAGQMIRRAGAHAADTVFLTGTLGDAALGLEALRGAWPGLDAGAAGFLADRYRLPRPRVALGPKLRGLASAAIDVSDGLLADLGHLCEASRLSAVVETSRVPLSAAARSALALRPAGIETVLTGGDDYEILFTAPGEATEALSALSRSLGVPITPIGRMQSDEKGKVVALDASGQPLAFRRAGWTHF
jgi:thiamine-monophosphate kinase